MMKFKSILIDEEGVSKDLLFKSMVSIFNKLRKDPTLKKFHIIVETQLKGSIVILKADPEYTANGYIVNELEATKILYDVLETYKGKKFRGFTVTNVRRTSDFENQIELK